VLKQSQYTRRLPSSAAVSNGPACIARLPGIAWEASLGISLSVKGFKPAPIRTDASLVPITPITGTRLPVFPLYGVGCWFHTVEKIPRYRNYFLREARSAQANLQLQVWKTDPGDRSAPAALTNSR
jgi:hypothetical protein